MTFILTLGVPDWCHDDDILQAIEAALLTANIKNFTFAREKTADLEPMGET
jgi:hypothetical protein